MKRIISILLIIITSSVFFGCELQSGNNSQRITLTTENAYDYLNFSIKGYGENSFWSNTIDDFYYSTITTWGDISGISGYTYNDVEIEVSITFTYDNGDNSKYTQVLKCNTSLNLAGNGSISKSEKADKAAHNINVTYIVTDISGYVTMN